jgi:mono/diheme cytochrome c family protein
MRIRTRTLVVCAAAAGAAFAAPAQQPQMSASSGRALVDKYCVGCHNQRARTAGLMLDKMDLTKIGDGAEIWEKVVRKVRGGMMPPPGMPRPDQAAMGSFATWLESGLDAAAEVNPNPGKPALHRLNRTEYANAIRDLLDFDVDASKLLPPDDSSYGFDNIADVLGVSPIVLEQYLTASYKVAHLAVGDPNMAPGSETYRTRLELGQDNYIEGLPLGTRGGLAFRHYFPLDGEYDFKVTLTRDSSEEIKGLDYQHEVLIVVDGVLVHSALIGGKQDREASGANAFAAATAVESRINFRTSVKAGPHTVGVTFRKKTDAGRDEVWQPFSRTNMFLFEDRGNPVVHFVTVNGPFHATGPGDTPSRRRIFSCHPANRGEELPCARKILSTLARHAYRRPVTETDLESLLGFYQTGRNSGAFEMGIEDGVRRILASPQFIFRPETDPAPGTIARVTDLELASRLSFFLWSSIPDDELINVASQGKLKDQSVLESQVRRMLVDPRAQALATNFAGQWLYLRNLAAVDPNIKDFPNFDDNLRQDFQRETELFFGSVVHEDRNVVDLLTANYTFLNERLAKHYNIPNVYGSAFRRVELTDEARFGLLGKGSTLIVTSYASRTSPVKRGKWILENILGTPPPAPPPNVPPLKENAAGFKGPSVRERLEAHRANPACSGCHSLMDPLGFALENFDAVGEWRTVTELGGPIDTAGQLADGTKVDGPISLRQALLRRPQTFVGTMTEKLLTYALGRGLEYYDMPAVRAIVRESGRNDYRFSSLVMGVVESAPFRMKKAPLENATPSLSARALSARALSARASLQ